MGLEILIFFTPQAVSQFLIQQAALLTGKHVLPQNFQILDAHMIKLDKIASKLDKNNSF